ncbi:hypothetical protein GCM10022243_20610 [Saccharothrix violaceirubra]|uniref:DUF4265 domain-containing protein n=1 Tax=Saccharothrix violaceirubra TaxID=413306 RepID=A0A7W7T1V6_9PSEU|nr:hypothetical protein [Saccharothrix violaceirubra]MBB4965035.1 hypothetical protein [Saccharothrix violaceirubra]
MSGTALTVLTPYTAERVEPIVVAAMTAEGMAPDAGCPEYWRPADGLPYGYTLYPPDFENDPAEVEVVERAAGRTMLCDVGLHIFVSDVAGRPLLGRLAQRVAREAEGWVLVEFRTPPAADLIGYLEGKGRCVRVEGHVHLDASAMAAWYAHPAFHVIK